eukprot:XP_006605180.1 uncharacterized protein LOC100800421 [Glycine max]
MRSKRSCIVFKVDFEKAYDSVSWQFLLYMLRRMGFHERWIRWIRGCLTSATMSVLVNDSPTAEFKPQRGLRQGDPLAPLLFDLVAEGLTDLMREAVSKQCFTSFLVGSNKVPVDVLQYADDTIFFGEASMANVKTVKVILKSFELVSGLRINFAKSKFGAVGQSEEWCLHAAEYLNCALLQFPFCYLGIPIGVNPKRKVVCDPIIRKFEARLNRALKAVINRLSAIQRQFLWGGNREGKNIAWMGRGDQILFWEDVWAEDGIPLKDQFPDLYRISSQRNHIVVDIGSFSESGWEWNLLWRRNLFDNEMGIASKFIDQISEMISSSIINHLISLNW